eukprot:3901277-Amphidinium_carterae.1
MMTGNAHSMAGTLGLQMVESFGLLVSFIFHERDLEGSDFKLFTDIPPLLHAATVSDNKFSKETNTNGYQLLKCSAKACTQTLYCCTDQKREAP